MSSRWALPWAASACRTWVSGLRRVAADPADSSSARQNQAPAAAAAAASSGTRYGAPVRNRTRRLRPVRALPGRLPELGVLGLGPELGKELLRSPALRALRVLHDDHLERLMGLEPLGELHVHVGE